MKKLIPIFAFVMFAAAAGYGQNANVIADNGKDRPFKVLKKPQPSFRNDCGSEWGLARLRVTFDKSGKVTATEIVVPSGCESFDASAVRAALRIRFQPAIRNGQPASVTKLVEYTYRTY